MTSFEIAVTLVLIWYGVIFGIMFAALFSRTKINKSCIEVTNKVLDCHDSRIDGIVDRMDFLVQIISDQLEELKKGGDQMAGDSLKEDQIRLGLNEFEAITRLLLNKGVRQNTLHKILDRLHADYQIKQFHKVNKA